MEHPAPRRSPHRLLAASGALLAAAAVALSAYASHGLDGLAQSRLQTAAMFAFGHGIALAALAPAATRRLGLLAVSLLATGVLLFSGSLVFNVVAQWPTALAPLGGMLLVGGWVLWATDAMRR